MGRNAPKIAVLNSVQLWILFLSASHQLLAGPVRTAFKMATSSVSDMCRSVNNFSQRSTNSITSLVSLVSPNLGNSKFIGGEE